MAKLRFAVGLLLFAVVFSLASPTSLATASPDVVKWSAVNIPAEGKSGDWVLAEGSDVRHLTMATDGTLYCYANPSGTSYTLFKSTDDGYSWSYTGNVTDNIVALATAAEDADTIGYATSSQVYQSNDAGESFIQLPPNPGGAGSNNIEITSIAVARSGNSSIIAIGTRDTDNTQYGGVYILNESESFIWIDTNLGNYDVYAVAFSPNFATDGQLVAVVTDETDTFVTTRIGNGGWGTIIGNARLDKDNSGIPTPVSVDTSATIAFPEGYDAATGQRILFVGIDAGAENGDVYRINGMMAPSSSTATDLNIGFVYGLNNVDVTSLAVTGDAMTASLLAGAAGSAQVYFSPDGGINWTRSIKPPTGQSKTYVLMAPDFSSSGRAYAATSGTESAVSYTTDSGVIWNQSGLIDTDIDTPGGILDLAISPGYSEDDSLFMLTYGGEHSLWHSLNGGTRWERVFTSTAANVDSINRVALSPQYGNGSQVVFIAGSSNGNPVIWKSTDNGQSFGSPRITHDPVSGAPFDIDAWTVVDDDTLFIGSYDGSNGVVYRTTNGGLFYFAKGIAGSQSLNSVDLSPNYEEDKTILVGNTAGWVYWSNDNGTSFEPLPTDATSAPLTDGNITVAFDPEFNSNNTVYAASDTANKGIHRFIIGTSISWESIDSTLPAGATIGQVRVSADGILYATNTKADGGMERSLSPTYPLGPTFETVTRGLDDSATLTGLRLYQNQLWAIDTTNSRVMTYIDSLNSSVTLTSPSNKASGIDTTNVSLDWETLSGATEYRWQLDYDTDFSTVPTGFEGDTRASTARLPTLELATTYYWRVRATEPVLSPWSDKWSFNTSLGGHEATASELYYPKAGASGISTKPVFQWNAVAGADSYELLVSTDISFTDPSIVKIGDYALPTTAWQCDVNLNYDTTYYWKVRACSAETQSAWSAVSAFTTGSPPEAESPPLPQPASLNPEPSQPLPQESPSQPSQSTTPDWTKWLTYLGGALLLTLLAMLVTLVIIARRL